MNQLFNFGVGDLLIRTKAVGMFFVEHEGVAVGSNTVLTNTPEKGEHLTTPEEFAAGNPVRVVPTGANPAGVIARAREILANPKKYNPFARNCQHTSSYVVRGTARSRQVMNTILVVV